MIDRLSSDQNAPAWQPDNLAGFRVGDGVTLPGIDCTFEVIALADPLLILRAPSGKEIKAGWQAVARVRTRDEIAPDGPEAA